jgi:hypothetical protein
MDLGHIHNEIERMRIQVGRQRKEILQLQRAGIHTAAAEALLERMLAEIDGLCAERDRLKAGCLRRPGATCWEAANGRPSAVLH